MIEKIKYVLFAGEAGSGKTYNAKMLQREIDEDFKNGGDTVAFIESFARPLKNAADVLVEELFSKKFLLPVYKEKIRPLYQGLGMTARAINPLYWVHKLKMSVEEKVFEIDKCTEGVKTLIVIIDDVRFSNEVTAFENSIKFKITRPGYDNILNKDDPSELGLSNEYFDAVIPELDQAKCKDIIKWAVNE